jgi:hypothetical protein
MNLLVLLRPVLLALAAAGLSSMPSPARAADVWLMTYGTGDRIEERFGHNALWVRDPARGVDAIYNFGFFDFDTPGFYFDYLFGDLIYYAVARDPGQELAYYEWRDRSVRAQRLDFDEATVRRLTEWLDQRVAPENRNFRYDYYLNNCSTRIRDALDFALDGALRRVTEAMAAEQDFRAHTRRLVRPDPVLYLAIQAALGPSVDRPISRWDEMFLPEVVAETVAELKLPIDGARTRALVTEERWLLRSGRPAPDASPAFPWWPVLVLLLGAVLLLWLPWRMFKRRGLRLIGWRLWLVLNAVSGGLLLFLWTATDHLVTAANQNLFLLNPLLILLWRARGGRFEQWVAMVVFGLLVTALTVKLFGPAQWNYDLLLALVPVQVLALALWLRASREHAVASAN